MITVEMDDAANTAAGSQTGEAAIPMQEPEILENQAAQTRRERKPETLVRNRNMRRTANMATSVTESEGRQFPHTVTADSTD